MKLPVVDFSGVFDYMNLIVLLLGLVIILHLISKRFARKRVLKFGNFEILERVAERKIISSDIVPLLLRITSMFLIILLISGVYIVKEEYVSKADFVIAIDTSGSMLTQDYEPNRLEFVKQTCIETLRKLRNTKVGLVTFAGKAYIKLKPTTDMDEVIREIERIEFEQPGGTAIGDALIASQSLFEPGGRNKSIILITDGINNVGTNLTEAIRSINGSGIRIYAIGIGTRENRSISIPPELKGLNATAAKFPNLDVHALVDLANKTNGEYFIIDDRDSLRNAFESGLEYKRTRERQDLVLLLILAVVLLIEWGFEITKYRSLP
ncbi:MAG: hypothetical protein DRO95_02850 [Candidatus Altiarchaeales archaeon]|nr:MAG: hypothetical protein DRO95_02850 [Candidatus Altiarchaeales archaeon]HDO82571.1 VWA domain-containing protein [Candidatus Altiarchaeales archaeon]HEX55220.1 VWA domain-containing protein [Candidatus Altiarchaeales archaeon]